MFSLRAAPIAFTLLCSLALNLSGAAAFGDTPQPDCDELYDRRGPWSSLPSWEENPNEVSLESTEWMSFIDTLSSESSDVEEIQILDTLLFCMQKRGIAGAAPLRARLLATKTTEYESSNVIPFSQWENALDALLVSKSSVSQNFSFSAGNEVRLRLDAEEFQSDVLRTIHSAQNVLVMSALNFQPDRFGLIITTEILARLLGYSYQEGHLSSVQDRRLLFQNLWGVTLEQFSLRLENDGTYDVTSWDLKTPQIDWDQTQTRLKVLLQNSGNSARENSSPAVFLFSDRLRVKPLGPISYVPLFDLLKRMGVQIAYISNNNSNKTLNAFLGLFQKVIPFAGINHSKIIANEHEALISGGNIEDKVGFTAKTTPRSKPIQKWHDLAVNVRGPILKDVHQFFFQNFNNSKIIKSSEVDPREIFRKLDVTAISKSKSQGSSRIITTINSSPLPIANHGFHKSQTEKSLEFAIKNAEHSIYIETPFFSDIWATSLLLRQAKKWKLKELKKQRREKFSTCGKDLDSLDRKKIVVLIPKNMDQFAVKVAERGLIGFMVKAGIDVCRWSADVANRSMIAGEAVYVPKTMMHGKAWMVDERIAYVGTANINRRAMRGDLEIGVLSTDSGFVGDLKQRVFKEDFRNALPETKKFWNFLLLPVTIFWNAFNIT